LTSIPSRVSLRQKQHPATEFLLHQPPISIEGNWLTDTHTGNRQTHTRVFESKFNIH